MVEKLIFAFLTVLAFGFLFYNLYRFILILKLAKQEKRTDRFWLRLKNLFKIALFQSKILREPFAGVVHVAIFWGFLALLFSASEAVFQGFYPEFSWSFLGWFYTIISFSNDLLCVGVICCSVCFFASFRVSCEKVARRQAGNARCHRCSWLDFYNCYSFAIAKFC